MEEVRKEKKKTNVHLYVHAICVSTVHLSPEDRCKFESERNWTDIKFADIDCKQEIKKLRSVKNRLIWFKI